MKASEFCNRDVVVIEQDASVADAAKLMRRFHVGSVVVVETGGRVKRPTGVLTDRDIVVEFVAQELSPQDVAVGDAMTGELVSVEESTGLFETIELMRDKAVRRLPVVDANGALVGLVASDDVLELMAEQLSHFVAIVDHQWREEVQRRD